jgi:hypothetical protein
MIRLDCALPVDLALRDGPDSGTHHPYRSATHKLPAFMADLKRANWGRIGRRIVAHDYGRSNLISRGLSDRMRKVSRQDHER